MEHAMSKHTSCTMRLHGTCRCSTLLRKLGRLILCAENPCRLFRTETKLSPSSHNKRGCNVGSQVPVAVACSAPEARVQPVLETTGLWPALEAVVTAEDVYRGRPDPEAYLLAAQKLQRPPVRCVVIGNSNQVHHCISFKTMCGAGFVCVFKSIVNC